jgi:hypothetical protein
MQVPEDTGKNIRAQLFWFDSLQGERVSNLLPVDLAQQFLDAVFRAVDADFHILNERRIWLMNKEIPVNVIDLFPPAVFAAAEK